MTCRRHVASILLPLALLAAAGCATVQAPAVAPPVAERIPKELAIHGDVRVDPYYWLNERENPKVIAYLEAENAYTTEMTEHTKPLQERLFEELKGRVKQDDSTVPYREGGFYYYTRFEDGKEYPVHCRKPGSLEASEQVMLDVNAMAEGEGYLAVSGLEVDPSATILAFAEDRVGRRIYTIRFKNLETGEMLPDTIPDVTSNLVWAEDGKTLFYTKQDPQTLRSYRIYRHALGSDPASDRLVYEETDPTFNTFAWKTKSKRYVMIGAFQTLSSEVRYVDARRPEDEFRVFLPRRRDHEYSIDHHGDHFYIRTNSGARNFRLMRSRVDDTAEARWQEVVPHRDDVLLEGFEVFRDHLVITERRDGLIRMRIRPWAGGAEHELDFGEPAYAAYVAQNPEMDTTVLRYGYTSMTTPRSIYDYDMTARTRTLMKRDEILGGFDPANYRTERIAATAPDGVSVPISVVYRADLEMDGTHPLMLYGYGSYGNSLDATFSADRLSLLDRGFVYAIAHVRGGEELGRAWYESGKLLQKKNTFTDFIACADHLVAAGYADPQRVFASGGSAGGLLIGAVVNMKPERFRAVVAKVPFVDVVTTMLDESIPLTTGEYDEWGNPNDETYYEYMLSYSPYDQVEAKAYPALLVTTGIHDSQVQYWEPAKWVAKLRATKTDDHPLLLKTEMEAGHGGVSGRYKRWRDTAFEFAFVLDQAGLAG